jgi:hypothetical protein
MDFCIVLASLNDSTYRQTYASPFHSLRPLQKSIVLGLTSSGPLRPEEVRT